jgi:hypothetical protein
MDTLDRINNVLNSPEPIKAKPPEYPYEIYLIGDDKVVTAAALQLNKRIGAFNFVHVIQLDRLNVVQFKSPIQGVPVRDMLKRLGFKTRKNPPIYDSSTQANIRNGSEDKANESGRPEAQAEGLRENVEPAVLGVSNLLDSKGQNIQHTEAS